MNRTQQTWFSADLHLGHQRIIDYCKRPFASPDEMEAVMLERFNRVLRKRDLLYVLGDLAWSTYPLERFFGKLNTTQCHLILGNHDARKDDYYRQWFQSVQEAKRIRYAGTSVHLFHYPLRSWAGKAHGGYHLYGHCHGVLEPGLDRSMDVGVDTHDYAPWSWEEVNDALKEKPVYHDTETPR